ncbi:MAG: glycosyltransferase [Terrimicrobiaceae bacterium]
MRIAFFTGPFPVLSETFVLRQISYLRNRGHEVHVFPQESGTYSIIHPDLMDEELSRFVHYPSRLKENPLVRVMQALVLVFKTPSWLTKPWRNVFCRSTFGAYATNLRLFFWATPFFSAPRSFDAIISHFETPANRAAMLREAEVITGPHAAIFHTRYFWNVQQRVASIARDIEMLTRLVFSSADALLPIHECLRQTLINAGSPPENTTVMHMGAGMPTKTNIRKTSSQIILLSVCRLVEKKGVDDALQALAQVNSNLPDWHYRIVGDGSIRDNLEQLSNRLGLAERVTFYGNASEIAVRQHLADTDIFLAPSKTAKSGDCEGIPVSIMEAAQAGIPVIATNHEGIPECVQNGICGLLVKEGDVSGLADAIIKLANDAALRAGMGKAAQQHVNAEFDQETLNRRLEELLYKIAGKPSGR